MPDLIKYEKRNAIALLMLNRSEKLNALNYATNDRLMELLGETEDDAAVRAFVPTSTDDCAFSAGGNFTQSVKVGVDLTVKAFCMRGQIRTRE